MRKRKDEWMRKGDLSGWFVLALITPLGLDKLCLLSVCVVCVSILYVHGLCARTGVHGSV